jgi:hypothetical protein
MTEILEAEHEGRTIRSLHGHDDVTTSSSNVAVHCQLIFTFLVSQAQTTSLGDPLAVVSRCNYHIQNLAISMADDYALTQAAPLSLLTGAVLGCLPRAWSLVSSSRWPAIEVFPRRRFLK